MAVQAALGSDIALAFDECTPFHVTREYTARSMERTHRWLERCLRWHDEHGPGGQVVYGIVQGGVEQDLRLESAATVAASACDGIAIGGSLGQDKAQMREVVAWTTEELERRAPERPRHLLGIGDVDDLDRRRRARGSTRSTARCRPGSGATASRSSRPRRPLAHRPRQGPVARIRRADPRRLPLPRLLARVLPRLPPLPPPRQRADRAAPRNPSQPHFHRQADGRPASRDRGRAAGGGGWRRSGPARRRACRARPPTSMVTRPDQAPARLYDRALGVVPTTVAEVDDVVRRCWSRSTTATTTANGEHEQEHQEAATNRRVPRRRRHSARRRTVAGQAAVWRAGGPRAGGLPRLGSSGPAARWPTSRGHPGLRAVASSAREHTGGRAAARGCA